MSGSSIEMNAPAVSKCQSLPRDPMISARRIDLIQFEYGGCYLDAKSTLKEVYHFLKAHGYRLFRILPHALKPIPAWEESLENYQYSNYVAMP